ncbi:MAG: hypothetical protein AAFN50_10165 [Pseudomonadota bacterium]
MKQPHALYYAATLVFLVLDYMFNVNLRAAFLEQHDVLRLLYYLFLFGCLWLVLRYPGKAMYVGTTESLVTVVALVASFAVRVLVPTDAMLESGEGVVTGPEIINFLISGLYGYFAYMTGIRRINEAKRREMH